MIRSNEAFLLVVYFMQYHHTLHHNRTILWRDDALQCKKTQRVVVATLSPLTLARSSSFPSLSLRRRDVTRSLARPLLLPE